MTTVVELDAADAEEVVSLYRDHPGCAERSVGDVRRALRNTDIALGVRDGGRLLASLRVTTDFTYYAKVYDVVVAGDRRGEGIGRQLVTAAATHPALSRMAERHLELVCREGLVPFYRDCGFERFDATGEHGAEPYVKMNFAYGDGEGD